MFSTESHAENLALLRAILEAKFHEPTRDLDIPQSAILARVATRLRDAVDEEEARRGGARAVERGRRWRSLDPARDEWKLALAFAGRAWREAWPGWSEEERIHATTTLIAPFELSPALRAAFMQAVEVALQTER